MKRFESILQALADSGVEFILVGGVAAGVHGSARSTLDVDVVYRRTPDNLARLVAALSPHEPYLRGAPPGLPFRFDVETVRRGLNFTLTTRLGDLDLLGEVTGGGGFEALLRHSEHVRLFDRSILCLGLPKLIEVKRAAGRPKDLEAIAELELIAARRRGSSRA
jgi:predicted nucleotidyltransferase